MTLIFCADDRGGLTFAGRRQSGDGAVRADLLREAQGKRLWMEPYSLSQFSPAERSAIQTAQPLPLPPPPESVYFLERSHPGPYLAQAERLVVYRWNRLYPAQTRITLPPEGWRLHSRTDFPGLAHKTITKEVYLP